MAELSGGLTVSVAMATFNGAFHVGAQLDSIAEQTVLPVEVVVSDDGSQDATICEVEKRREAFRSLGIALRLVKNQLSGGVSGNFQNSVRHCSAELIALCDQDDVWLPQKIEALREPFEANSGLLLTHSDAELVAEDLTPLGMGMLESLRVTKWELEQLRGSEIFRAIVRRNLVTGATTMLRRSLVINGPQVPEGWLHDYWWAVLASSQGRAAFVDQKLILYRQHATNQVGAKKMGISDLLNRFREPRSQFLKSQEARNSGFKSLIDASWPVTLESRHLINGRLKHFEWLGKLSESRVSRIAPVTFRLLRGDYARYRRGVFDALRDLVQPSG